jgi:hypothetical protein
VSTRDAIEVAIVSVSSSLMGGPGVSSSPSTRPASGAARLIARAISVASNINRIKMPNARCTDGQTPTCSAAASSSPTDLTKTVPEPFFRRRRQTPCALGRFSSRGYPEADQLMVGYRSAPER